MPFPKRCLACRALLHLAMKRNLLQDRMSDCRVLAVQKFADSIIEVTLFEDHTVEQKNEPCLQLL